MKEKLSYRVPVINYGEQGKPPKSKFANWPNGAIYSLLVYKSLHLPDGVNKDHYSFLEDAISSGAIENIDPNLRSVYLTYFTTDHSVRNLPKHFGNNYVTRFRRIRYAIQNIWDSLPEDLKEKYDPQKIKKLKGMHSTPGRSFSQKEREYLSEIGRKRMTPEFRRVISEAVSESMTPAVRARIKRKAIQISSTPKGKERLRTLGKTNGHRFTSEESRRINAARFDAQFEELPREEREKHPLEGAIINYRYLTGKRFPKTIKRFFRSHTTSSYTWKPLDNRTNTPSGYISYSGDELWYHKNGTKYPLTTDTLAMLWNGESPFEMDRKAVIKFGIPTKAQVRDALRTRMNSLNGFFQQPHTTLFQAKP